LGANNPTPGHPTGRGLQFRPGQKGGCDMRRADTNRRLAAGFTLIELLVVIGINVLLAGLLLPAVTKVREAAVGATVRHEIGQIGVGVENFKSTMQVQYIPTALYLTNNYNQNPGSVALQESRQFISKVWPKALVNGQNGWTGGDQRLDGNQILLL